MIWIIFPITLSVTLCVKDGKIFTSGGASYKALVVPGARLMPADVMEKLLRLADEGATIVFLEQYPEDVPGLNDLGQRRAEFNKALAQIKEREGKEGMSFSEQIMPAHWLPPPPFPKK